MLVVGWIEVGQVAGEFLGGVDGFELMGLATTCGHCGKDIGQAQVHGFVRPWSPCFEVGHLDACG